MSKPQIPSKAMLFTSIVYKSDKSVLDALKDLELAYGPIVLKSKELDFDKTDYYAKEMGDGLKRLFIGFEKLIDRGVLADKKLDALRIEKKFMKEGKRSVNIDPGLLSFENVLLSTCKNFSHRIYLGKGVFAEVTLTFEQGEFVGLKWTYPDYASKEVQSVLFELREKYKELLRCEDA